MDAYDTQIIEQSDDVCRVLDLRSQVKRLRWADRVSTGKVNSDDCRFALGLASFPDQMKGRLEPKEWRPLIASTLIYRRIIARNPPGSAVVSIGGSVCTLGRRGRNIVGNLREQRRWASILPLRCLRGRAVLCESDNSGRKKPEIAGGARGCKDLRKRGTLVNTQKD